MQITPDILCLIGLEGFCWDICVFNIKVECPRAVSSCGQCEGILLEQFSLESYDAATNLASTTTATSHT